MNSLNDEVRLEKIQLYPMATFIDDNITSLFKERWVNDFKS